MSAHVTVAGVELKAAEKHKATVLEGQMDARRELAVKARKRREAEARAEALADAEAEVAAKAAEAAEAMAANEVVCCCPPPHSKPLSPSKLPLAQTLPPLLTAPRQNPKPPTRMTIYPPPPLTLVTNVRVRGQRRLRKRTREEPAAEKEGQAAAATAAESAPCAAAAAPAAPAAAPLPKGAVFSELAFRLFENKQRENGQSPCISAAKAAGLFAYDVERRPGEDHYYFAGRLYYALRHVTDAAMRELDWAKQAAAWETESKAAAKKTETAGASQTRPVVRAKPPPPWHTSAAGLLRARRQAGYEAKLLKFAARLVELETQVASAERASAALGCFKPLPPPRSVPISSSSSSSSSSSASSSSSSSSASISELYAAQRRDHSWPRAWLAPTSPLAGGLPGAAVADDDELPVLTVPELKALCRAQRLQVGGVKADLIARLIESARVQRRVAERAGGLGAGFP